MIGPRIVGLFEGYGGLTMGVQSVLGGDLVASAEIEPAMVSLLAQHHPGIPNLGDVSTVDWSSWAGRVDVMTGGFPCQDVSLAGLRRGLRDGTRSGLWSEFARGIDTVRPGLVVIENVRGLLSAEADRNMEPGPWDLGRPERCHRPALRALGAVLGDLADLGYDARWCGVRAADAGAPHGRYRVFIVASPADANVNKLAREWIERDGHAPDDRGAASRPWGDYAPAIERWESTLGRIAPAPTNPDGKGGAHRLAPQFVEWMMGLPAGHVTDPTLGLTRAQQLKALGNGVVPQQAALALRALLSAPELQEVAA